MFNTLFNKLFTGKAGVWTAIFTGILTVFTYMEYKVSQATSEIQRSSERAFLSFAGAQVGPRLVGGAIPSSASPWTGQEIDMAIGNNGETPAREVKVRTGANAFYPDIPTEFDYPLGDSVNVTIGPKSNYITNAIVPREVLSDTWHGKKSIFIWGTIAYRDVFPNSPVRLTEFCISLNHLTVNPMSQPTSPTPSPTGGAVSTQPVTTSDAVDIDAPNAALTYFNWTQCRAHNCYDKDCEDYDARVADAFPKKQS